MGSSATAAVYDAQFTSAASVGTAGFAPPSGYSEIFNGGASSGGLDEGTGFDLRAAPDYTGWNADHTGVGNYDDPVRGWSFNNNDNNGGYTDAYSETENADSGYVEFEWTFKNVLKVKMLSRSKLDQLTDLLTGAAVAGAFFHAADHVVPQFGAEGLLHLGNAG